MLRLCFNLFATILRLTHNSTEGGMMTNYVETNAQLRIRLAELSDELTGTFASFARLNRLAMESDALPAKTKELMALAISIALRCDGCIAYHVHDAIRAGASRQEMLETLGVAVMMGGGPATVYAAQAMDAIDQFLPHAEAVQAEVVADFDPYDVNAD